VNSESTATSHNSIYGLSEIKPNPMPNSDDALLHAGNGATEEAEPHQDAAAAHVHGFASPVSDVIGRTSATDREPNTSDTYTFWLADDQIVNPFDIVQVAQVGARGGSGDSTTYGLVTSLSGPTDAPSHLANYISNNFGDISDEDPNTPRQAITIASVNVLENDQDIYMPVRSERPVKFVAPAGIATALGVGEVPEEDRIPAGLIKMSTGAGAMAFLDARYVTGPEAAHVNISGISGLATKTSYAMFLLQSIQQKIDAGRNEVAFIILNVKQADLLSIDKPGPALDPEQGQLWTALGLSPEPFKNVHYLLPRGTDGIPNSFSNMDGAPNMDVYAYDLIGTRDKLDLLFSHVSDSSNTMESLTSEIASGLDDVQSGRRSDFGPVNDWDSLLNGAPLVRDGKAAGLGDIKPPSVGKFRRQLRRMVKGTHSGLFVSARSGREVLLTTAMSEIKGGHTYVVDIAKLKDHEQTLVFGDLLRSIYDLKADQDQENDDYTPPKKVIFFVDELNKYAPAGGQTSPIATQVLEVSERGRGFGIILLSAEQFLSAVHPRVTGNAATKIMGRTGASEVTQPDYRFMDSNLKGAMTRLSKGELIISHALYRQPVKIIFPRPAYKQPE